MTLFIKHRVNQISELDSVEREWGVEIDLRSVVDAPGELHLAHDPWQRGDDFRRWLAAYKARGIQGPIILNTKEDGLEERILNVLAEERIDSFFFLDTAIPTLVKWTTGGRCRKFAMRLSSFEGPENLAEFEGRVEWVWVDCFDGVALPARSLEALRGRFKVCLVSPELQAQPVDAIDAFAPLGRLSDAICTKRPDLWAKKLKIQR